MTAKSSAAAHRLPPWFLAAAGLLVLGFAGTLRDLIRLCAQDELYSYIYLIPFISAYLAWPGKGPRPGASPADVLPGSILAVLGLSTLLIAVICSPRALEDALGLKMLAFVLLFAALCAFFLGRDRFRSLIFPLAFLVFLIPFPAGLRTGTETFLQYGSAGTANYLFDFSGLPVFRDGLSFLLPGGIKFNVEPECSGIHSSMVLLITSVIAAHLLLRTRWKQALLLAVVLPLALLRNGFRIFVIGRLCVRYGDKMFNSWVHIHGGPFFFALSLIPFLGLLIWLVKSERRRSTPPLSPPSATS